MFGMLVYVGDGEVFFVMVTEEGGTTPLGRGKLSGHSTWDPFLCFWTKAMMLNKPVTNLTSTPNVITPI